MDGIDFMKTKVLLIRNEWFYIELKMYKSRQYELEGHYGSKQSTKSIGTKY
jgi:hypothetical protein